MFKKKPKYEVYLHKIKQFLNLDSTVYLSIGSKVWSIIKTPLSVIFITKYLNPEYQGYWYTFLSMSALTVFAELGFTSIIIQYVSHEFAHLELKENNEVDGDNLKVERFVGLIRFCINRYLIIVPIAVLIVLLVGFIFFRRTLYDTNLIVVWIIYAFSGGLTLFTSLLSSIIQGINKVKQVLQINLYANIISTITIWLILISGGGIWALTISSLMLCFVSLLFFFIRYYYFFVQVYSHQIVNKFNWGKEVYDLQIRYSISWIAGYFIFNFVTPVTLYFLGPVMAGKVGITFTSTSAILQMSHSWVANKIPELNMNISLNKKTEAKSLFRSLNKSSLFFFLLCSVLVLIILQINFYNLQIKFLPVWVTGIVLISEFAKLLFGNWAVYLRAYKSEPYLTLSVANGTLTLITFLVCLKFYHSFNVAIIIFTLLQLGTLIVGRKKYIQK
jgi:O-antigen/teichoic acid export membrane protein